MPNKSQTKTVRVQVAVPEEVFNALSQEAQEQNRFVGQQAAHYIQQQLGQAGQQQNQLTQAIAKLTQVVSSLVSKAQGDEHG